MRRTFRISLQPGEHFHFQVVLPEASMPYPFPAAYPKESYETWNTVAFPTDSETPASVKMQWIRVFLVVVSIGDRLGFSNWINFCISEWRMDCCFVQYKNIQRPTKTVFERMSHWSRYGLWWNGRFKSCKINFKLKESSVCMKPLKLICESNFLFLKWNLLQIINT